MRGRKAVQWVATADEMNSLAAIEYATVPKRLIMQQTADGTAQKITRGISGVL